MFLLIGTFIINQNELSDHAGPDDGPGGRSCILGFTNHLNCSIPSINLFYMSLFPRTAGSF